MALFEAIDEGTELVKIIGEWNSFSTGIKIDFDVIKSALLSEDLKNNKNIYYNTTTRQISVSNENNRTHFTSKQKNIIELKLKEKYLSYNDTETMINVIFYVDSLMKLADAGYFITEKNREQTYINIIESADEELIEVLEDYLLINDEVSMIKWNKKQYLKKMKTLKELDENSEEFKKFVESI